MIRPHHRQSLWLAFLVHRLSGVALAVFLPVHFWILSWALTDLEKLEDFLHWTQHPWVHLAEMGLVFLLSVHLFGGIRLIAFEWLPWHVRQKNLAAGVVSISVFMALWFLLSGPPSTVS